MDVGSTLISISTWPLWTLRMVLGVVHMSAVHGSVGGSTDTNRITRTGGTWAEKYAKKS